MTSRKHIEQQIKRAFSISIAGMAVIVLGVALGTWLEPWPQEKIVYVLGGILIAVGSIRLMIGIKCPHCGHAILWSNVNLRGLHVWDLSKATHCPHCHVAFDK